MGKVVPEELRELSKQVDAQVTPHLEKARSFLTRSREITASNFTATTFGVASTYAVVAEFMGVEIDKKETDIAEFCRTLTDTARNWEEVEEANTFHGP